MRDPEVIWPVEDPDSALIREVYARYGLAMFMAQVLEHSIVNVLLVFRFMPTRPQHANAASWESAFDNFYHGEFGKTFGNMLRTLEALDVVPIVLLSRLRTAKKTRDILAHSFFRDHDLAFMTQAGRSEMIAFCENAVTEFSTLDKELDALCSADRVRYGMTDEWIEQKYQQTLAQAERDSSGNT